ncbi:hypothetical protein [Ferrovibrio xuzhouensis]|uniref:HNH endonuclease n=1 Tax=Ferrovibrio xuzhouensis TaxID=1576914 RepID=A0ABV7VD35_9PROT
MPIRPENKARYPANWSSEIVPAVRARSGGRCEFEVDGGRCPALQGEPHPITGSKVVLTVAHLDHQPENCDMANLKDACQRCHNRYDMPMRRAGMQARAHASRAVGDLFERETP